MKIAVTYDAGLVFQHFGRSQYFKLYVIEDGQVKDAAVLDASGSGHAALAGLLKENGVQALICGGIGAGAKQALAAAGIVLYGGVSGSADEAARQLAQGSLQFNADVQCDHHHEGHEHGHESCGHGEGGCHHHA